MPKGVPNKPPSIPKKCEICGRDYMARDYRGKYCDSKYCFNRSKNGKRFSVSKLPPEMLAELNSRVKAFRKELVEEYREKVGARAWTPPTVVQTYETSNEPQRMENGSQGV